MVRVNQLIFVLLIVDNALSPARRADMSLEEQLRELLEKLDMTCTIKHGAARTKRSKQLRKEINVIRRKLAQQRNQANKADSPSKKSGDKRKGSSSADGSSSKSQCWEKFGW